MEASVLRAAVAYQKQRFLDTAELVPRDIGRDADKLINAREMIFISGIRRCGKSSLMKLFAKHLLNDFKIPAGNIAYVNFDDPKLCSVPSDALDTLYQVLIEQADAKQTKYLFLDEVQSLDSWERWLNSLYEFEKVKIFVTGSNSSLLESDAASLLTGRKRNLPLYPFSFKEFCRLSGSEPANFALPEQVALARKMYAGYLAYGGFPEAAKQHDSELLKSYYEDILYRDILGRNKVVNRHELIDLCGILMAQTGMQASSERLKNALKLKSSVTIRSYLTLLDESFLFGRCGFFSFSARQRIYNPPKMYIADHAMAKETSLSLPENQGWILENIIYNELRRRGAEVFYWKSGKGKEVDFLCRTKKNIYAIQAAYRLDTPELVKRETESLFAAKAELGAKELLIITNDKEEIINGAEAPVSVVPVWKWLLESDLD